MDVARRAFFEDHPDPMLVYELASLRVLDVNGAAVAKYGYARDEFLAMTIADLHPAEDLAALRANVAAVTSGLDEAGVWRHRLKSGDVVYVDVTSHTLDYDGVPAELVAARDVTRLIELERSTAELAARERRARRRAEAAAEHFQALFEAAPGAFLVLEPETYTIVAVSDAYLLTTMTRREDIKGWRLFDVFPDDADDADANGAHLLRASLDRVRETGLTDVTGIYRYPIPRPPHLGGRFEERYWNAVNTPVRGPDGELTYIIHRPDDVTALIRDVGEVRAGAEAADADAKLRLDVVLRSQELEAARTRLEQRTTHLRTAQRLLGIGLWSANLDTGEVIWSQEMFDIFGHDPRSFVPSTDAYRDLVHPDDRAAMAARLAAFEVGTSTELAIEHRAVRPDGRTIHVRGAGELTITAAGRVLTGVVRDVSDEVAANARLAEATNLLRIAGHAAKLGGWRADLRSGQVVWSEETAAIHELPGVSEAALEHGIEFYAPEYRNRVREVFDACVRDGTAYDEVLQLVTATGRRIWVRAIGEAERDAVGRIVAVRGAFQDVSELVAARERLEGLSRRLHHTLETMGDAFYLLDAELRFVYLNAEAQRLLRRCEDDLLGRIVWDAFPEAVGTEFQERFEAALRTGQSSEFVAHYAPLDAWGRVRVHPGPEGLAVYVRDVTLERAREEQLRLLETAVGRMNDILLITDAPPPGTRELPRIVFVNAAFVARTGYTAEEVIGRSPRLLEGPATQPEVIRQIRVSVEVGRPVRCEAINYTKAGDLYWVETDIVPIVDGNGRRTHWVALQRDITERKAAERALELSEERFRLVTRATSEVIWDWDFATDTIWWNDNLLVVFGYDPSAVDPRSSFWVDGIHDDDREHILDLVRTTLAGRGTNWDAEYRFRHADGRLLTVVDRGFVIRDGAGKAVRMLGTMTDVTERRALDERLRQSQKLEAVGQLTGGVAHDFNNLLTVIVGNAELLMEGLHDRPSLHPLAAMTMTAAERAAELTSRLLAFGRRQPLDPKRVDLDALLAGMEALLRRTLTEAIDLRIVRHVGLWEAEVDPGQLEVALLNLVINARDAMPGGGCLSIETANAHVDGQSIPGETDTAAGDYVLVAVSDTGSGMSREVRDRAFEPFFTTKEVGKGSGLGLSMVYGFVRQSGGHVRIYSEVNEGTVVRLFFPRSAGGLAAASDRTQAEPDLVGGSEHVLVVEDEDLLRSHVVAELTRLGYRVSQASAAAEALATLRDHDDVDLLLTDVVMPGGMNGRELADEALALRPGLRVIFTSGYTQDAINDNGRLAADVDFLPKPFRRQDLARKVREVLDR